MADPFVAEIRIFCGNFAPTGWATCDGQILPISQNTALFSLLGTFYGGNGQTTFALPNLQGSVPLFWGQGAGLSLYDLGQQGGSPTITLLESEIPLHTHAPRASAGGADTNSPTNATISSLEGGDSFRDSSNVAMSPNAIGVAGSSFPHNNLQPYLTATFIIALQGVYPPRG